MKLLTITVALLSSLVADAQESARELVVTLLSVNYVSNKTEARWIATADEIARQPTWNPIEQQPPLEARDAWATARRSIATHFPDREIVLDQIAIKNVRFLHDARDGSLATVDRWFYVIEAKPQSHRAGKALENRELWTVVMLLDGRVIAARISKDPKK